MECPVCHATGDAPCRALDFGRLPTHHPERVVQETETTPLADASDPVCQAAEARALLTRLATDMAQVVGPPKAYAGDDVIGGDYHGWSLRAYDDASLGGHTLRLVVTDPDGTVVREGACETYKVWTVLAHWREGLPALAETVGAGRG